MEQEKYQFKLLKPEIQKEIINNLKLNKKNKLDLVKAVVYYIAPHDQLNINETESKRLKQIEYLVNKFNIDINEKVPEFFTSFLCFAIYFRQEKIANYFIDKGAYINNIDYLGLSPINYLCAKVIIGENKEITNQLNKLRDKIQDKVLFSTLDKMMNHKVDKLEYFHKNQCTTYCLYDAYTTSQIENITNGDDYLKLYKILAYKIQEININEELSKYYAVEIEEYRNQFSADSNNPQFFNKFKETNKKNIIEYILAGDEEGAIQYLFENPESVNDCDIDLQSPLQWAIFMSQEDKPIKFYNLIDKLIKADADPDHKNITGYNSIELAAWYDYCVDQKNEYDKYTLLNIIFHSLENKDTTKFKKYTSDIQKYKTIMKYNHTIESKKNILDNLKNNSNIHLKKTDKFIKDEKKKILNEQKLMSFEDTRQVELSNRIADELLLDDFLQKDKKVSNKTPKSKKDKLKAKNHKQLLKQNAEQAKIQLQKEAYLKDEKYRLEAIQKAEVAAEQARLEAIQKAEVAAAEQARLEAIQKAEVAAEQARLEAIQKAETAAAEQARLEAIQKAEETAAEQARLEAIQKAEASKKSIINENKNKRIRNKKNKKSKKYNLNEENSCDSDLTSIESTENNNYVPYLNYHQLMAMSNTHHGEWIYIMNPWLLNNKYINSYQWNQNYYEMNPQYYQNQCMNCMNY